MPHRLVPNPLAGPPRPYAPALFALTLFALVLFAFPAPARSQLLTLPLPDVPEAPEVLVLEVELAPGQASQPHRHHAYVFVYVLEGVVEMQVAGGELRRLSVGEMFHETPADVHTVSRNPSTTERARILVHFIKEAGAPVTTPATGGDSGR